MSGKSITVVQADSRANKCIEHLSRMICDEALECTVNCNDPLVASPHTLEVDVNRYSFAILLYVDVAVLELNAVLQPQMPEFTELLKSKHLLPPCTRALCPAMLRLDVYQ